MLAIFGVEEPLLVVLLPVPQQPLTVRLAAGYGLIDGCICRMALLAWLDTLSALQAHTLRLAPMGLP